MFSIDTFYKEYQTQTTPVVVNGRKFDMLLPRTIDRFIDPHNPLQDFPLWAKIWPASWILAEYLARLPAASDQTFLEIGAGTGFVGIVAASFGHRMTLSEYNPDALNFARANAVVNNCPQIAVVKLDWHQPQLEGKFDVIVGSEVTFRKEDIPALLELFQTYLNSTGEIILAGEMRQTSNIFFEQMNPFFHIKTYKKILRSDEEQIPVLLFRMTNKSNK